MWCCSRRTRLKLDLQATQPTSQILEGTEHTTSRFIVWGSRLFLGDVVCVCVCVCVCVGGVQQDISW